MHCGFGTLVAEVLENPANPHVLKAAMNFRGHLNGGLLAGAITASVAVTTKYVSLSPEAFQHFTGNPLHWQGEVQTLIGLFLATLFMALFPDLDTASVPQRWFFRGMFVLLAFLFFTRQMELFAILAFVSLLPVMHKHRGWTHWKITPWVIALFLAVVFEYFRAKDSWAQGFSWQRVWEFLQQFWMYVFACVLGHYTHLLLDSRQIRWLPFIRNSTNHH
ncbi:MAG TPA: hypothetical protein EYQ29_07865 [Candidatus Lambdaproteobacteria bacterium]|nr:hypothetical protein [Candidatus Lambdaproteobacteria bacterium]